MKIERLCLTAAQSPNDSLADRERFPTQQFVYWKASTCLGAHFLVLSSFFASLKKVPQGESTIVDALLRKCGSGRCCRQVSVQH